MNRALTVIVLLAFPVLVAGQVFSPGLRINDDGGNRQQRVPTIQTDDAGTLYVLWADLRSNAKGDIFMATSQDGGKTFSANRPVHQGGGAPAGKQRRINFVLDSRRYIHAIWGEVKVNNQPDVYYTRSEDGGTTFTPPVSLSADSSKYSQDFPVIAVDGADNLYVAFLDARDLQQGLGSYVQILLTKSVDGGRTFSKPVQATNMPGGIGGACECCALDIAASPQGNLYIAFRTNIVNRRDIFVARSYDQGATFEMAIPAQSEIWMIDACPITGPSIALDKEENAHMAWRDARQSQGGKDHIYYTVLPYGAPACNRDMRISDSPKQVNYPTVRVGEDGTLFVTWQDARNDAMDVFYTYSLDGGNTFAPGRKLTDESGSSRQEEAHAVIGKTGVRYAVWQDQRRDEGDIFFSRDEVALPLVKPGIATPSYPDNGATMPWFSHFEWLPPANLVSDRNTLYDLTYEKDGVPATIRGVTGRSHYVQLTPGSYRWRVHARTLTGSSPDGPVFTFTVQGTTSSRPPGTPDGFTLVTSRPNPVTGGSPVFLDVTTSEACNISITLRNLLGQTLQTIHEGSLQPGRATFSGTTSGLVPGVYAFSLRSGTVIRSTFFVVEN